MKDPLTFDELQRAIDSVATVLSPRCVRIEMSVDMFEELKRRERRADRTVDPILGLPVRIVPGTGIARPVYE